MPRSPVPAKRRKGNKKRKIKVIGARGNNLKNVSAKSRSALFTCVTGVSGGGKSTFLIETLYKAAGARLNGARQTRRP
jgi:excinuclease ABC subunit A